MIHELSLQKGLHVFAVIRYTFFNTDVFLNTHVSNLFLSLDVSAIVRAVSKLLMTCNKFI